MTAAAEPGDSDGYAALAAIYDEWQARFGAFWRLALPRLCRTLVDRAVPDDAPLVDLGCGTGSLLLSLAQERPRAPLCGVDASAAMLAAARRKPGAAAVRWMHASFEDAPLPPATFGVATSFFDALNHAAAPGALARVFGTCARSLTAGGLLIFDLNNAIGFQSWWRERRVFVGSGWTLVIQASYDEATRLGHGRAAIDRHDPRGLRTTTEVIERCFDDDEVEAALTTTGFTVLTREPWSPMPGDPPGKTWWVAQRL